MTKDKKINIKRWKSNNSKSS